MKYNQINYYYLLFLLNFKGKEIKNNFFIF